MAKLCDEHAAILTGKDRGSEAFWNLYTTSIPAKTDAGTHTVYYKVDGSDNWNSVDAQMVEVTIAPRIYTVTFDPDGDEGTDLRHAGLYAARSAHNDREKHVRRQSDDEHLWRRLARCKNPTNGNGGWSRVYPGSQSTPTL